MVARRQVAQFKATVLLLPNGSDRVTSAPVQPWESDKKVEDEEVLKLLATSLKKSKSSKKTAKKKARDCPDHSIAAASHHESPQNINAACTGPTLTSAHCHARPGVPDGCMLESQMVACCRQAKKAADAPMDVEKEEPAGQPAEPAGDVGDSHAAI